MKIMLQLTMNKAVHEMYCKSLDLAFDKRSRTAKFFWKQKDCHVKNYQVLLKQAKHELLRLIPEKSQAWNGRKIAYGKKMHEQFRVCNKQGAMKMTIYRAQEPKRELFLAEFLSGT